MPDPSLPFGAKYNVEGEPLGKGGMGTVYKAKDTFLDRYVAIKVLHQGHPISLKRFRDEAKLIAKLDRHPALPIIYQYDEGRENNSPFLVMEYIEGNELRSKIKNENPWPEEDVYSFLDVMTNALHHIHAQGIIHRDIKPENIIIKEDGQLVLVDFGLARHDNMMRITTGPLGSGTPLYMSPEQITNQDNPDGRTDLYSLGLVAYEMLIGSRLFMNMLGTSEGLHALHTRRLSHPYPKLSGIRPPLDCPELAEIIEKCIEPHPDARFHSATDLLDALSKIKLFTSVKVDDSLEEDIEFEEKIPGIPPAQFPPAPTPNSQPEEKEDLVATLPVSMLNDSLVELPPIFQGTKEEESITTTLIDPNLNESQPGPPPDNGKKRNTLPRRFLIGIGMILLIGIVFIWNQRSPVAEPPPESEPLQSVLMGHQRGINAMTLLQESNVLFTAGDDSSVRQWTMDAWIPMDSFVLESEIWSIATNYTEEYVMAGLEDGRIMLLDRPSNTSWADFLNLSNPVRAIAFGHRSNVFAAATENGNMGLGSFEEQRASQLTGNTGSVRSLLFTSDDTYLVSAGLGEIIFWNVATSEIERRLTISTNDMIQAIDLSQDQRWLAGGGDDKTIRIWDLTADALLSELEGNKNGIRALAFSPDGTTLAVSDRTDIRIIDVENRAERERLEGHQDEINALSYHPTSGLLLSASDDGVVRLWDITRAN